MATYGELQAAGQRQGARGFGEFLKFLMQMKFQGMQLDAAKAERESAEKQGMMKMIMSIKDNPALQESMWKYHFGDAGMPDFGKAPGIGVSKTPDITSGKGILDLIGSGSREFQPTTKGQQTQFELLERAGIPEEERLKILGDYPEAKEAKEIKAPKIQTKKLSETHQQDMEFNPKTGKYDIPFGAKYRIYKEPKGPSEKIATLKQIAGDYFETVRQLNSAMRGTEVYLPQEFREPTEKVVAQSKRRLDILAKRYVELGGDIKDLARTPPVEGGELLPEGLTEEAIEYYISNHGMTREEVIQRYMTKMSQ